MGQAILGVTYLLDITGYTSKMGQELWILFVSNLWRALFTESTLAETTVDHNILDLLYSSNLTEYSVASAV
jgi:hypothetical protein